MTADQYDVVVVGGGVIGCAAARELAPDHDVLVLEKGQVAAEATALAAGEVTMTTVYVDDPAVADYANEFFRAYDGTGQFAYTERESLEFVFPAREEAALARADHRAEMGVALDVMDPETAAERYPNFETSEFAAVIEYPTRGGWLDPYTLAVTYKEDAEDRGAEFRTDTAVTDLLVADDRVQGVEADGDEIHAEHVVAAAGWRTPALLADHLELPVQPYRTQCIVLDLGYSAAEFPIGSMPEEHVYFRPEHNGDFLIGGFSHAVADPEGASGQADEAFLDHVAELVPRFVHDADRAQFVNGWAGVDGATPDTIPVIDAPADAPDGLVVATGFNGRGIMTSPVAAAAVRSFVTGEDAPFPLAPFALDRFESRSPDFEFRSVSAE